MGNVNCKQNQRQVKRKEIMVRRFWPSDLPAVERMDELSGHDLSTWVSNLEWDEDNNHSWGCFLDGKLIGYCTIGYADVEPGVWEYPRYNPNSLLLSDVFVMEEHRHKGYALHMVKEAIKKRREAENELVFLALLVGSLRNLYEKAGFHILSEESDYFMVLEKN